MTPPIYRARRKDNGEWVEGMLIKYPMEDGYFFVIQSEHDDIEGEFTEYEELIVNHIIDPSTLAISFEDMVDKNGKRIFAALNESGVGGDYELLFGTKWVWRFSDGYIHSSKLDDIETITPFYEVETKETAEVVGIYEGD